MPDLKTHTIFTPQGDQPGAIDGLVEGVRNGERYQVLLGVTGSGKTFTMAKVIERMGMSTLVLAPNKTLAAQLYSEFRDFFPANAVEYFVSYYDYYQPEAYLPSTDTYIEKDSSINDEIDRLRHGATSALLSRDDVIIVASVSCIFGLGSPDEYLNRMVMVEAGREYEREALLEKLVDVHYKRNDYAPQRGAFRARGDVIDVFPAYTERMIRIEMFDDLVERITELDPLTGEIRGALERVVIWPATHFLTPSDKLIGAVEAIQEELEERLGVLKAQGKLLEAQRLKSRTRYDLEMISAVGYCQGIENYSRYLSGRREGEPPHTLIDFFGPGFLTFIDESHITVPQLAGMYNGDRSRKETLVEHGFRLPSALDNRPLTREEFFEKVGPVVFVSATPADWEMDRSTRVLQQVIRPTGLVDPEVEVRDAEGQIDDLIAEIQERVQRDERVLVTTLTKRMSESLSEYLVEMGVRTRYLHSEIGTVERVKILKALRAGEFDVLVGINLLREGLDLPEVSLVAILDADKQGFLRSKRSLVQTMGRASRNVSGKVLLYAQQYSNAMEGAIRETRRRRSIQLEFNREHGITPESISKDVRDLLEVANGAGGSGEAKLLDKARGLQKAELERLLLNLEEEMRVLAEELRFEEAARLRDEIERISEELMPS
ncbi:MAG: excinuclease ABC subunit UvrB [Actinobacteria bacterium]|nr:excinuclease ABC subunit UvrB [Actinomycetota bacterium]MCG2819141.1 excinuclease ABC subunit UvrB [Actinomycetes bacterium]MBU4219010.1 excinuclease ABC subunit UvrB [Actinomycetota bacterium]MBU4359198.1 excinuclease ABC subunit UvrB [Actinomycetota bacterium]MBU4391513.1 excinuclease ABC subunit UvrB [Actinomycetota bacterium]